MTSLERSLERRERQAATLVELGRAAVSCEVLQSLFDLTVRRVAETLEVELCKILELLPSRKEVLLVAGVGWKDGLVGRAAVGAELDSQAGYTLKSTGPVLVDDLRTEKRFTGPALLRDHHVVSGMSVVIGPPDAPWGVLGAHSTRKVSFTIHDAYFIQSVANLLWDVIERQDSQRLLRESEERLRAVIETAVDGILTIDAEGRVASINSAGVGLFGYRPEEVVGRNVKMLMPEPYRSEHDSYLRNYATTGTKKIIGIGREVVGRRKDGSTFPMYLAVSETELKEGRLFTGIVRDTTERQQAEESLRESEERFRTIADSAPVLIWLNDGSGCSFVNQAYLDFLGLPHQTDVRGYDWAQYVHPEDRETYVAAYVEAAARKAPFDARFRFRRHDGEYRWMHSTGVPRVTDSGELLGYNGCTYDVHDELMAVSGLRKADRRREEFLAVLGHELRNPLAPLKTGVELLHRLPIENEILESVRPMMERQLLHLTRLVDDLLDVARITRGKIDLQTARVDLRAVVSTAVEQTRRSIQERRHELVVEPAETALAVEGDFERLTQVVSNLLTNAARYGEPGGRIRLRAEREKDRAVVRVSDTCYGIPPEHLETIFEMFSQVPEHRARIGGGGLGIGLPLSRQLIQLHGGSLDARSDGAGRGSEFVLRLPLSPALVETPAALAPSSEREARRRVLVVDDNADAAETLCMVLEGRGHEVQTVYDGPAALETVERLAPQIVLLDIGLPEMDGYEVARRLRATPNGQSLLLIALTGWGQEDDRERARAAGFDAHVTKPVSSEALSELFTASKERVEPLETA